MKFTLPKFPASTFATMSPPRKPGSSQRVAKVACAAATMSMAATAMFTRSEAAPSTYQFTGAVTKATGIYNSLALGTAVTGTYTIDYDVAYAQYGALGSSTSSWEVVDSGGSGEDLPSPIPSILFTTAQVGAFNYVTNMSFGIYFGESRAYGALTGSPAEETGYNALESSETAPSNSQTSQFTLSNSSSNPLWTSSGQPLFANANGAVGEFQTEVNGTTSLVEYSVTSFTPIASAKALGAQTAGCTCATNTVPAQPIVGDPINPATGNVYEEVIDYQSGGQNQNLLKFVRAYNSMSNMVNPGTFAAELGKNWRSNFDRYLNIITANSTITAVYAERADGQVLYFTPNGSGGFVSDSDVDVTLTQNGVNWTLVDHNDVTETYTALASGEALLTSIVALNGYTQNLFYNSSNQLTSVTDSNGRTLGLTYNSSGLLNTLTTPGGLVLTYGYNSSGLNGTTLDRLASVSYNTSPVTSQTYLYENTSYPFALTGRIDENNNRANSWGYDNLGRGILSEWFSAPNTPVQQTTITYNPNGTVTVTNPLGNQDTYTFTTLQTIPKVTGISRAASPGVAAASRSFTYDANGYQNSATDWNGNLTTLVNDSHGDPTSITEASGTSIARTTGIAYDPVFVHLPKQIVEPTRTTNNIFDGSGATCSPSGNSGDLCTSTVVDTLTNTPSRTWTYTWNATGEPLTATDPRGNTTTFVYSAANNGNLATIANALSQVTEFTSYNADGRLLRTIDPNGLVTKLTYDVRGNLLTLAAGSGTSFEVTTLTRNADEYVTEVTNPDKSTFTYTLDFANRLTTVTDSLGEQIKYTLDAAGDRTTVNIYNASSTQTYAHSYTFDVLSRMATDVDAYGHTTNYGYDSNSNRTSITDPLSNVTGYVYDALNRTQTVTDPLGNETGITYSPDTLNLVATVTTPRGVTTTYVHDGFGDITETQSPDTGPTTRTFDLAGNLSTSQDANGDTTTYAYDALNRVSTATYEDGTTSAYQYDTGGASVHTIGRLRSITDPPAGAVTNETVFAYDVHGRVNSKQNILTGQTYAAIYNATTGQLTSETYPSGMVTGYKYDPAGQMDEITVNGAAFIAGVTHQPFGPAKAWRWSSGEASYSRVFDLDGRLTSYPLSSGAKRSITYDDDSRVHKLTDTDASQIIGYDADSRVNSYTGPFGNGTQSVTYDNDGNRTSIKTSAGKETDTIDAANNQITRRVLGSSIVKYGYDADGNTLTNGSYAYTYDNRSRLISAGGVESYAWDGLNERITKQGTAGTVHYAWGAVGPALTGRLLGEYSATGAANQETIVLDGTLPVGVAPNGGSSATPATTLRLYAGQLSEPRRLTDAGNALYWSWDSDPFGVGLANQNPSSLGTFIDDMRFPGQLFDSESTTHYNLSRSYDPARGRYLQSDAIGLVGGVNTYSYVLNNPPNLLDATGTDVSSGNLGSYFGDYYLRQRLFNAFGPQSAPSGTYVINPQNIFNYAGYVSSASDLAVFSGIPGKAIPVIGMAAACIAAEGKYQDFVNSPNLQNLYEFANAEVSLFSQPISELETVWSLLQFPKGPDLSKQYPDTISPVQLPSWWPGAFLGPAPK